MDDNICRCVDITVIASTSPAKDYVSRARWVRETVSLCESKWQRVGESPSSVPLSDSEVPRVYFWVTPFALGQTVLLCWLDISSAVGWEIQLFFFYDLSLPPSLACILAQSPTLWLSNVRYEPMQCSHKVWVRTDKVKGSTIRYLSAVIPAFLSFTTEIMLRTCSCDLNMRSKKHKRWHFYHLYPSLSIRSMYTHLCVDETQLMSVSDLMECVSLAAANIWAQGSICQCEY